MHVQRGPSAAGASCKFDSSHSNGVDIPGTRPTRVLVTPRHDVQLAISMKLSSFPRPQREVKSAMLLSRAILVFCPVMRYYVRSDSGNLGCSLVAHCNMQLRETAYLQDMYLILALRLY